MSGNKANNLGSVRVSCPFCGGNLIKGMVRVSDDLNPEFVLACSGCRRRAIGVNAETYADAEIIGTLDELIAELFEKSGIE